MKPIVVPKSQLNAAMVRKAWKKHRPEVAVDARVFTNESHIRTLVHAYSGDWQGINFGLLPLPRRYDIINNTRVDILPPGDQRNHSALMEYLNAPFQDVPIYDASTDLVCVLAVRRVEAFAYDF